MDFGIAKIQRITNMTQTGIFMGSPSYMSPEQVRGRDVDNRSDIYSLGVLFYELITGKLPFTGSSTADIAMRILNGDFAHPRFIMAGTPDLLDQCIVQCMALSPENRPQLIEVVGEKIDALLHAMGLESSMQELERCFKDPKAYGDRLARILKVSQIKQEPTLIIENNQRSALASWNSEAINSPIPRPDMAASSMPANAQRKDHFLPPRSVPHFTKRQLTPELIAAHLPERRHQQRPMETTRLASGSKFGQYPAAPAPQPTPRFANESKKIYQQPPQQPRSQMLNPHQHPREVRPVSRMIPATPKRQHRHIRYVVKETHYQDNTSGSFAKFVLAILLLSCAGILWVGNRKDTLNPSNWISFIEKSKRPVAKTHAKADSKNQAKPKSDSKLDVVTIAPPALVKDANKSTSQPPSEPLPKFAEKAKNKLQPPEKAAADSEREKTILAHDKKRSATAISQKPPKASGAKITSDANKLLVHDKGANAGTGAVTATPKITPENSEISPAKKSPSKASPIETKNIAAEEPETLMPSQKPASNPSQKTPVKIQEKDKETKKVQISIASTPAAELFVNGKRFGTTNNNGTSSEWVDVEPGKNKIELRRSGFTTKIETLMVSASERQKFGPYILSRGSSPAPVSTQYRLTLATNLPPVEVTIINIETNARQNLSLTQVSKTISLERGIYEVTMTRNGDTRKRRLDFSGAVQQLTFSVEFKEANN